MRYLTFINGHTEGTQKVKWMRKCDDRECWQYERQMGKSEWGVTPC
jgi:hypothetical protein